MTSSEAIIRKINEVKKNLAIVKKYQKYTIETVQKDETLRGAIQYYLYILCQSVLDTGEMYITTHKYRMPSTYADIFDILHEQEIISASLASVLRSMAGFRNILAHRYGDVQLEIVYGVLQDKLQSIEDFLQIIEEG